jgi:hypothetical protein
VDSSEGPASGSAPAEFPCHLGGRCCLDCVVENLLAEALEHGIADPMKAIHAVSQW